MPEQNTIETFHSSIASANQDLSLHKDLAQVSALHKDNPWKQQKFNANEQPKQGDLKVLTHTIPQDKKPEKLTELFF